MGAKIKRWREERSWSQDHLAEAAGVSLRTVQRVENGDGASRETIMALAAAFDVDAMSLAIDARNEAEIAARKERAKTLAAMRLGFFINLASYVFGLIIFTVISVIDGVEGYAMFVPALWWGVGVAGFGLALVIVELSMHYKDKAEG